MAMSTSQPAAQATINYGAGAYDTLPGICSRFYVRSGYGSFGGLIADVITINTNISDWTASLAGQTIRIPTVAT